MNILATQYTLATRSLEIYVAGCSGNPHCTGCHNPESWDFSLGERFTKEYWGSKIAPKVLEFGDLIDNIMIFGGEPLDQNIDSLWLLLYLASTSNKKVWVFTRYELKDIPSDILRWCDYIKCGKYIPSLITNDNVQYGIKLATSNQKIYKRGIDY